MLEAQEYELQHGLKLVELFVQQLRKLVKSLSQTHEVASKSCMADSDTDTVYLIEVPPNRPEKQDKQEEPEKPRCLR
uniref:SFRICE_015016 n=1 Tax=Spodoptera frugiperda TaxID=7108 RepID=A0A2H1VDT9_SPOFR